MFAPTSGISRNPKDGKLTVTKDSIQTKSKQEATPMKEEEEEKKVVGRVGLKLPGGSKIGGGAAAGKGVESKKESVSSAVNNKDKLMKKNEDLKAKLQEQTTR